MTIDIVSLGEPMVEFSQSGETRRSYLKGISGDTLNCVVAAARLGGSVAYLTKLGSDSFADDIRWFIRDEGISDEFLSIVADRRTGVYFIHHDDRGHHFDYYRNQSAAASYEPCDLPLDLLKTTRFFHSSGISLAISESMFDSVGSAMKVVSQAGGKIVLDANVRPSIIRNSDFRLSIEKLLPNVNYFLLSEEDAEYLIGTRNAEKILSWALGTGARSAILKKGAEGSVYADSLTSFSTPAFNIDLKDATGAGDCFAGALMCALCRHVDIQAALRYASAAAALTCEGYGGTNALPRADKVNALLANSFGS